MAWWECPHRDHPLWNRPRINQVVTDLLAASKLDTHGLISHRFPFAQAEQAYQLIDEHPDEVVKVVLAY
jgi:threonine dehydrogenase-like Zn-dependent dehydrogenase